MTKRTIQRREGEQEESDKQRANEQCKITSVGDRKQLTETRMTSALRVASGKGRRVPKTLHGPQGVLNPAGLRCALKELQGAINPAWAAG